MRWIGIFRRQIEGWRLQERQVRDERLNFLQLLAYRDAFFVLVIAWLSFVLIELKLNISRIGYVSILATMFAVPLVFFVSLRVRGGFIERRMASVRVCLTFAGTAIGVAVIWALGYFGLLQEVSMLTLIGTLSGVAFAGVIVYLIQSRKDAPED